MLTLEELRSKYKPQILELAKKYGVTDIRVFGSVARGDARADSDVDFLVKRLPKTDIMDIGGFYAGVEDLLHHKIDVVSEGALSHRMKDIVINEALYL
jgi:hypothetical protein